MKSKLFYKFLPKAVFSLKKKPKNQKTSGLNVTKLFLNKQPRMTFCLVPNLVCFGLVYPEKTRSYLEDRVPPTDLHVWLLAWVF